MFLAIAVDNLGDADEADEQEAANAASEHAADDVQVNNSVSFIITDTTNNFLGDLGRRITQSTNDHRESAFLFQRLSVLIQRYSATLRTLFGTFTHANHEDEV